MQIFKRLFDFLTLVLLNPRDVRGIAKYFKLKLFILSVFYTSLSGLFIARTFQEYTVIVVNIGFVIHFIQTVVPALISFYLGLDFIRDKKIKVFAKITEYFQCISEREHESQVLVAIFILFVARGIKLYVAKGAVVNIAYAMGTFVPELVSSMNDLMYVFCINSLTAKIKKFNHHLSDSEMNLNNFTKIEEELESFHKMSKKICAFYSFRLVSTIAFNFVQLLIAFYWIFIRIAFNHLETIENFVTFVYLVQPLMCIFTVFYSSQQFLKAVSYDKLLTL